MLFMLTKRQSSVEQNILTMLNFLLTLVAGTSEFPGAGKVLIKGPIIPPLCHVSRLFFFPAVLGNGFSPFILRTLFRNSLVVKSMLKH